MNQGSQNGRGLAIIGGVIGVILVIFLIIIGGRSGSSTNNTTNSTGSGLSQQQTTTSYIGFDQLANIGVSNDSIQAMENSILTYLKSANQPTAQPIVVFNVNHIHNDNPENEIYTFTLSLKSGQYNSTYTIDENGNGSFAIADKNGKQVYNPGVISND